MDRAIKADEVQVINWLLDHPLVDVTAYRVNPADELCVVRECGCGCASLYFKRETRNLERLADELAVYSDGQHAGLILWGRQGEIVLLEVYDFEPESSHRFPDLSHLCTWEELGPRNLEHAKREQEKVSAELTKPPTTTEGAL